MNSQLLDKLMKEEYERTFKLEYDESSLLEFFKEEEEDDDFSIYSEDDKTHLSNLISKEDKMINEMHEDIKHTTMQTILCKDEPVYENKPFFLMNEKEENDLHAYSTDTSHSMNFQEDEGGNDACNESSLSENEFCKNSKCFRQSLFSELMRENNDEDDDMYDSFTDITSYEDIFNLSLENHQLHLSEFMKKRDELKSEMHNSFTESSSYNYNDCSTTEDYKLPFFDEDFATTFLIKKNLLANNENNLCHKCGSTVKYYTRLDRGKRRKVLRCKKKGCQTTQSLRKNNSFWACIDKNGRSISKLSISAQLELVYYWCRNFSAYAIISITGKSNHTVYNWIKMCQEVPLRMFQKRTPFGGPGTIIHIDHRSLTQLKINKGGQFDDRTKSSPWVFVLYNNNEERYFVLEKNDTTALHKIIKEEVAVGSVIHSGSWLESNALLKYGYNHHIVDLDEDYNNYDANSYIQYIQRIENLWKPLVLFYKCRRGITPELFSSFLIETWWRGLNKSDPFNAFLRDLAEVF